MAPKFLFEFEKKKLNLKEKKVEWNVVKSH